MISRVAAAGAASALSLLPSLAAQQEQATRFVAGVHLVEVYATVTDETGEPVTSLTKADFVVREDGRPQAVVAFGSGEFPLTVALGIDRSWSMAGESLRRAQHASLGFLRQLRPGDRSMIVTIGSEADVVASLTEDRVGQSRAIGALDPWGTTALHDATIAALDRLGPEPGRQAFVVFSDGTDRYSRATVADVLMRARRTSALIYPIALGRTRPPWLAELAVLTGGRSFLLRDTRDLERTLSLVARELRSQYLLGYEPDDPRSGSSRWRSITVTLAQGPRGARVRARSGYLSD